MTGRDLTHLARHKTLFRYTRAFERSDFEAVSAILSEAANDPILERMILEVNDALLDELQIDQGTERSNHNSRGDNLLNQLSYATVWPHGIASVVPRKRWSVSLPLAAAAALMVIFAVLLALNALWTQTDTARPADVEKLNVAVFQRYISEAWNTGDVSVLDGLLAEDFVRHEPGRADIVGVDGAAVFIQGFRAAFPDAQFIIHDIGTDGDRVWVRGMMTGTHTGLYVLPDGALVPPSDAPLRMELIAIAQFERGKIAELWTQADLFSALVEIGAVGQLVQPNADCDVLIQQAGSLLAQAQTILDSGDAAIARLVMNEAEKLVAPCAEPVNVLSAGDEDG